MSTSAIILAAGKGTRMKSERAKVAHEVLGKPLVGYVIDAVREAAIDDIHIVIGYQGDQLKETLKNEAVNFVVQEEQNGTGHAVLQAKEAFSDKPNTTIIVLAGDCPLVKPETLKHLLALHKKQHSKATVLSCTVDEPGGYGRILRDKTTAVLGIREAKDCSADELRINEINTGVYAFQAKALFECLSELKTDNAQQEYYLTDVIEILRQKEDVVSAYCIHNPSEITGVNTRAHLAEIHQTVYQATNAKLMEAGVTIEDPNTTYIDPEVEIGQDSIIGPLTVIKGKTTIGKGCKIGPQCYLENVTLPDQSELPGTTKKVG